MSLFSGLVPIGPAQCFDFFWSCPYLASPDNSIHQKRYLLPSTAIFFNQNQPLADLYLGWNEDQITLEVHLEKDFISKNESTKGKSTESSLELFFDTRNLKTRSQVSKFCHHFIFNLNEQENSGREISRFRGDDMHPLCDPKDLFVQHRTTTRAYVVQINIMASSLHGYDPLQSARIGFTYKLSHEGSFQYFSTSSQDSAIAQNPSLWSTIKCEDRFQSDVEL